MAKSTRKSTLPVGALRKPSHGKGMLRNGGTNKGGTGRPPDEFKALCQRLACSAEEAAAEALQDSKHPAFIGALKWATENGYGKPKETRELSGPNGGPLEVKGSISWGNTEVPL